MVKNDSSKIFYNQSHLGQISTRGYYSEKIQFFLESLEHLSKNKNLKILDVACNDGQLTKLYTYYGEVLGIDINKQSISKAKKHGLNCQCIDFFSLSKKLNQKFDVVIAGDIIEHVFDTDAFLQKATQLLKPVGSLLLTTPNVASLGRRMMLLLGRNPYLEYSTTLPTIDINVGHIRYYTYSDLHSQLTNLKFNNISIFGDKINLTSTVALPHYLSKIFPKFSRNFMVICQKST